MIGGGSVSTGAWLSVITIVCMQTATLPHISSAVQCLVKDPVPLQPVRFCVWSS